MQRTCRHKIEKTTCKQRCCRGQRASWRPKWRRSREPWAPGRAAPSLSSQLQREPLHSLLAAVKSGEDPSPFRLLSLGLASLSVSHLTPIPALNLGSCPLLPAPTPQTPDQAPGEATFDFSFLLTAYLPTRPSPAAASSFPALSTPTNSGSIPNPTPRNPDFSPGAPE